jgi:hypothetical protein
MYLWKSHIQHHRKLDDLWTGFEIAKGHTFKDTPIAECGVYFGQGGLFLQSQLTIKACSIPTPAHFRKDLAKPTGAQ